MKTQATQARGFRSGVAVLLSLVALFCLAPTAEATRTLPSALTAVFEPGPPAVPALDLLSEPGIPSQTFGLFSDDDLSLFAALSLLDAGEIERLSAENHFRLFADPSEISHLVESIWRRKTALPASTSGWECNVLAPRDLAHICVDLFFQGAWTDPDTGIAYHRNRWYDPRTANWLSEDPLGAVDSPNLYAGFAWGPHVYTDPMGNVVPKNAVIDPEHWMYRFGDKFYQHTNTGMVVELDLPRSDAHHRVEDPVLAEKIREISGMGVQGSSLVRKLGQGVEDRVTEEGIVALAKGYWGACATPFIGGRSALSHLLGFTSGLSGVSNVEDSPGSSAERIDAVYKNYWFTAIFARIPFEKIIKVEIPGFERYEHAVRLFGSGFLANISTQVMENYENGATNIEEMKFNFQRAGLSGLMAMEGGLVFKGNQAIQEFLAEVIGGLSQISMDFLYGRAELSQELEVQQLIVPDPRRLD